MIAAMYILFVCYMPMLDEIIPKTKLGPGIPDMSAARLTSYLIIVAFALEVAIVRKKLIVLNKWIALCFFFTGFAFLSVSWSVRTYSPNTIQSFVSAVFMPVIISLIGFNVFRRRDQFDTYAKHMVYASMILSLMAIFQIIFGNPEIHGLRRAMATFHNPNTLAIFLVLAIPCINYCVDNKLIVRRYRWLVYALICLAIIATVSRKALITSVLAFGLHFLLNKQWKKLVALGTGALMIAMVFASISFISQRFTGDQIDKALDIRQNLVDAGLQMIAKKPLLGWGFDGFHDNMGAYQTFKGKDWEFDAHNMYITVLTDFGIIGFLAFISILILPLYYAAKRIWLLSYDDRSDWRRQIAVFCLVTILPFMINAFFVGGLLYSITAILVVYTHIMFFLNKRIVEPSKKALEE